MLSVSTGDELLRATDLNMDAYWRAMARPPEGEARDEPDMTFYVTGIPDPACNAVGNARLAPGQIDQRILAALAFFRSRGLPMSWTVGRTTRPADLGDRLKAHGLWRIGGTRGMSRSLDALPPSDRQPLGLTVKRVADPSELRVWWGLVGASFGFPESIAEALYRIVGDAYLEPPWITLLGWLGRDVVGTAQVLLAGGVAGIYCISTVEQFRGRGIGTAMTLAALDVAREMDHRLAILQATHAGYGLYARLGFQEYCRFSTYIWEGETALYA